MIKNDLEAKEGTIHKAKQFINELQRVLADIEESLLSDNETKSILAVIQANAIMRCLEDYPSKTQEIFERLKKSALN
jgi:hypothetical protein